jgi:hypothetical protein
MVNSGRVLTRPPSKGSNSTSCAAPARKESQMGSLFPGTSPAIPAMTRSALVRSPHHEDEYSYALATPPVLGSPLQLLGKRNPDTREFPLQPPPSPQRPAHPRHERHTGVQCRRHNGPRRGASHPGRRLPRGRRPFGLAAAGADAGGVVRRVRRGESGCTRNGLCTWRQNASWPPRVINGACLFRTF